MDVESRLAALEKSNRRLKTLLVCLPLVSVAVGAAKPEVLQSLATRDLFVVDAGDTMRGNFGWDAKHESSVLTCDVILASKVYVKESVEVSGGDNCGTVTVQSDEQGARVLCIEKGNKPPAAARAVMVATSNAATIGVINRKQEVVWRAP